jgi:hypothetical protein
MFELGNKFHLKSNRAFCYNCQMSQRDGRCCCRECVRSGSSALLSYYLRKKHERAHGLSLDDALQTTASSQTSPEPEAWTVAQVSSVESQGTVAAMVGTYDDSQEWSSDCDTGSIEQPIATESAISGPLLNWYRQSHGRNLTRERMDSLLQLLQVVDPGLPRQVRTVERREIQQTPDDFAVNNIKRSIVCGGCGLCEVTDCASECKRTCILDTFSQNVKFQAIIAWFASTFVLGAL